MAICGRDFFTQDRGWRGGKGQSWRLSGVKKRDQAPRKSSCVRNKRPTADLSLQGPRRPHRRWPSAGTHPATLSRGHTLPFQGLITAGNLLQRVHVCTGFTHRSRAWGPQSRPGASQCGRSPPAAKWPPVDVWQCLEASVAVPAGNREATGTSRGRVRRSGMSRSVPRCTGQLDPSPFRSWTPAPAPAGPQPLPLEMLPSPW